MTYLAIFIFHPEAYLRRCQGSKSESFSQKQSSNFKLKNIFAKTFPSELKKTLR